MVLAISGVGGHPRAQCATTFLEIPLGYTTLYYEGGQTGEFYVYAESNGVDGLQRGENLIERTTGIDMGPMFHHPCTDSARGSDMLIGKSCASPSDYLGVPTCVQYLYSNPVQ
jgi:hypothetical protein